MQIPCYHQQEVGKVAHSPIENYIAITLFVGWVAPYRPTAIHIPKRGITVHPDHVQWRENREVEVMTFTEYLIRLLRSRTKQDVQDLKSKWNSI